MGKVWTRAILLGNVKGTLLAGGSSYVVPKEASELGQGGMRAALECRSCIAESALRF